MTIGKGGITQAPKRRIRILLAAQIFWLALVCVLGGWWGSLVLKQAARIAELEQSAGLAAQAAQEHWMRTRHMVIGESISYFVLLLASTGVLFWLYLRDARRTRSLQAFFASLTHELRTPLTSIRLQAESISDGLKEDGGQRDLVQRLLEDSRRLERQVESILELARVEGGGRIFKQSIAIGPWLERVVDEWARDKVRVHLDFDGTGAKNQRILADQVAMQVILRNLVENSVRHSGRESPEIRIRARAEAGGVSVIFSDDGKGFKGDPQELGKLFEKGENSPGAGVGLYLVRTLMDRMGGAVRFASGGRGFEVSLYFPVPVEGVNG